MTDQLERDLTQMFRQHADHVHVPPVPVDLFTGEHRKPWGRRAAIGLVAAAAVAAIAVPLGLSARNDDRVAPPTNQPTTPQGIELPYLLDDELHVGDVTVPVEPNAWLQVTGSSVLLASSDDDGSNIRWQRLSGDHLEALPYLDGPQNVQASYDGRLVAAAVGTDASASVRIWDIATGAVIDTVELVDHTVTEDAWFWGFDAAGWLYWQDGATQRARTPEGAVVTIDTGAGDFAGIAPGGVLVRAGNSDTVAIGTVNDDGSVSLGDHVPVSSNVAWRDATTLAYQEIASGRVYVLDVTTGKRSEVTVKDRVHVAPVGWSGDEVVVAANDDGLRTDVVAVDPATGDQRRLFSFGPAETNPFASTGGTGAL